MKKMAPMSKSKGKKKKAPGPMDLAELEEAHSDVTKLTNTDLAGVAKMSNMYEDTDKLSEESGPSLKSAVGGGVEAKKLSVEYGISKKKVPDDSKKHQNVQKFAKSKQPPVEKSKQNQFQKLKEDHDQQLRQDLKSEESERNAAAEMIQYNWAKYQARKTEEDQTGDSFLMKKKTAAPSNRVEATQKGRIPTSVEIRGTELIQQLKSESKQPDRSPHQLVKNLLHKLKSESADEYILHFMGMEQLTDLVFYLLLTSNEDILKKVVAVYLPGCLHVTDQGVIWMASAFTGLTKVQLNGCHRVTETGLYQLIKLCKNLQGIQLKGTSVSILPKDIINYIVMLDGCPLISPEREIFNKGGFKVLKAPSYPKPADEDIVKLCIINGSGSSKSLIKHLKVEYENTLDPLVAEYNFKVRRNYTANMVECDETLSDLFITKRTLYILPVQVASPEAKAEAKRLFGLMCYIISKVSSAAFIIAAVSENGEKKCSCAEIKTEMTNLISTTKTSIACKIVQTLKQPDKLPEITFSEQESWKGKCVLSKALDSLYVDYCDVNMKQSYKEGDSLQTSIVKGMKAVCEMYPEFQEIAQPVFAYALSDSIQKILKDGALSLETAGYSNCKMMEFMAIMGKTCCASIVQDVPIVLLNTWLAKVVNLAYNPPPEVKNEGRVFGASDDAPVWQLDSLREALDKVVGAEQAGTRAQVLIKLGLSIHRSVVLSYKALNREPVVPVNEFFPDVTNSKDKDLFSTVHYRLDFDFVLPNFVIHKLMWLCSKLRRPTQAWQAGFILQDACVETLFEIVKKDNGSCLNFCVHMVNEGVPGNTQATYQMIWNTAEQYKIILDYVLSKAAFPYTCTLVSGKKPPSGEAAGLISYHSWAANKEGTNSVLLCKLCGDNSCTASLPWVLYNETNHSCWDQEFLKTVKGENIQVNGNVINMNKYGKCFFMAPIDAAEQNCCKFTFLNGDVESTIVSLGFALHENKQDANSYTFMLEIQLDLNDGFLLEKKSESTSKIGDIPPASLPRLGQTLALELREVTGELKVCELRFYRDNEVIGKFMVPRHRYLPSLQLGKQETEETSDAKLSVMIHPVMKDSIKKNTELTIGMRLEALDRKNPHLICVATITDISDDGRVKIHFDGWNSGSYDYYTEFSSTDLHPVGWCSKNMHKYKQLNQQLQSPKGWSGAFHWPQYCVKEKSYPVPIELFSAEQIETLSMVEDECLSALEGSGLEVPMTSPVHSRCRATKHRPRMFEQKALSKCSMSPALFDFFSNNSKFVCFLPAKFDVNTLKHPSMKSLMNYKEQNVHILCPGLKMELLHFVDYKGTPLGNYNVSECAGYLQNCYSGLIIQEGNIAPENCVNLCPGVTLSQSMSGQVDRWLKRLCYLNVCILEYIQYISGSKGSSTRDLMEIFKDVMKDSKPRLLFQSTETYVRCTGHVLSSMAGNELNAVPMEKYQQFYPFIQKLDFQNNFIERLPTNFFESFVNLEYLSVSNNQLVTLPNGLEKVKNLSYLDIAMNNILDLPTNFDVLAGSLTYLNISDNPLSGLPTSVYKLTKLEELYAENIGEIDSFSEIKNLAELITLSLGRNEIKSVPNELGDLPLAYLDLSGVPWFEQLTTTKTFLSYRAFNQTLNSSTILKKLSEKERQELFKTVDADESSTLTANEVLSLNDVLCKKYHRFGAGSLDYSETGGIPPPVLKIKTLKTLILKYHVLKHIPDEIKDLTSLKELDLSHNPQITSLSAELSGLPLKMIHLRECPLLKTPPKEIVARGFVAVMGYLKRLRLGASPCKRTKLMLVGLGGAGKTSLVSALMNSQFRAYMDHDEAITDGIDISKWELPVKGEKDPLVFSVWDFAGQTVYYNTHQFFLSNRAVYLLLWNVRQGYEHAGLDFWLSSIACHAPKAPILVVGTHADKVEKCRLPEASIQARFPQITGFFYVSSYTGDGIPDLKKSIVKVALQQKYMGEKIPEAWLNLEKKLIVLREEQQKDFLPLKQLDSIAQSVGIFDKNELVQAIQFLHDLGAAQFFDTEFLRSLVVIYPQWIVDVMACLVTVHQGIVMVKELKDGRLELKDVSGVWADYPTDLHPWLLRLTEEFDLTCPLPDTETSIVPCLLPDAEPKYDWPHADPEKNIKESITIYKFQYLPAGLFNRAQARLHQYSEGAVLWKKGSFLKKNDHKAVLLQTDDSEVIVRAQGFRPENFLFLVHEIIETLITESYAGVHYDFLVPCLECLNMNVKDPSMVSYMKVQRALELNAPFLQCDKFFHILSIAELRDTMPSDKMSEIDNHLRSSVRELIDLESETTINVFFVYSTKNVPGLENENKVVHPGTVMEDLRKHSDLKIAFTDKPETSDMEGITLSVKSANVVIIGMSDEFCEDSECRKLLMYIKDVLRKPVLLLLLGKTKKWQKGDLNMVFGSEVYVDMQKIERYPHKIEELYEAIKKKAATALKAKDEDIPQCFISYCWSNSHDAIAKGSREVEGALGWKGGDPREVKSFLESKGIHCWLDIERVGGTGLFHSIADGLREAKTMLVFVSDEYVKSKNCIMEFRYALTTLRIPVIVCVVGTGYAWERSEVGLLVVGHSCPKINLQFANETGYLEVLKLVQEKLPEMGTSQSASATEDNQRNVAFQEVLELTQRKFLRHIYKSVSSEESEPYPRLMVVDFLREKERKDRIEELRKQAQTVKKKSALGTVKEDVKGEGEEKSEETQVTWEGECSETEATVKADEEAAQKAEDDKHLKDIDVKSKYCFRLLCEYDQNWHESSATIFFPDLEPGDEQQVIDNAAPYLGRVYAILKHGKSKMECLNTPEGEKFQQKIEEICMKSGSDFYQEYLELRTLVMQQDKVMVKGKLQRCQVNGKTVWLCEEHKNASRSQTEQRYEDKFTQKTADIPIPTGELPDNYEPPEPIEVKESEEELAAPRQQHRKIFKKTSDAKPKLQRQTSQMCLLS